MPPPPRIDASAGSMRNRWPENKEPRLTTVDTNYPLLAPTQFSPRSSTSNSRSVSPAPHGNGRKSAYRVLPRSATSPLPTRSTSPEISLPQDCAFPPFPTTKSRSATPTPTTPTEINNPFTHDRQSAKGQTVSNSTFAPLSARGNGGGSILQRMNTIAPGPFNVRDRGDNRISGMKRTATMSSSTGYSRPSSAGSGKDHAQRPSTSSSNYTRNPSLSSISGGPRSTVDRERLGTPAVPALPTSRRPFQPEDYKSPMPSNGPIYKDDPTEMLRQENRSRTYPTDERDRTNNEEATAFVKERRPSEPTRISHKATPSVAAANRPLHEIGSTSSFKPKGSIRGRSNSIAPERPETRSSRSNSRTGVRNDQPLEDAPPLPIPTRAHEFSVGNAHHTPTESTSSNESSGSDAKSGSSRSTPPLSGSPQRLKRRSSDMRKGKRMMEEFQKSLSISATTEEPVSTGRGPPPSFSRPMYSKAMDPPPRREPALLAPDVRTDPAIQSGRPSPVGSPRESFLSDSPPHSGNLRISPAPLTQSRPSLPQRSTTANKGNCRGCGEGIKGKSVSSKDGQLSGRYHRACFVCKTCRAPFPTADFYVLGNHPYCNRHYHQLNGSLCRQCDRGIEGQYVETDSKQKCHPHCFTCQVSLIA